jgi:hypothetical protein
MPITSIRPATAIPLPQRGPAGLKGDKPANQTDGVQFRFQNPDGSWGDWVNPVGPPGPDGNAQTFETPAQATATSVDSTLSSIHVTRAGASVVAAPYILKKVLSDPGKYRAVHSADGAWWQAEGREIDVTMFNSSFGSSAADTLAWQRLVADAEPGWIIKCGRASMDIDSLAAELIFTGVDNLILDLRGAEFFQKAKFRSTLKFNNCTDPIVVGGKFHGLGGTSGEFAALPDGSNNPVPYDPTSGHYNGVAALAFLGCGGVAGVYGTQGLDHAGGFIYLLDTDSCIRDIRSRGIGGAYIAAGQNGNDAAVFADLSVAALQALGLNGPTASHDWSGWDIAGHAFAGRAVATRTFLFHSHRYLSSVGQHILYGTDLGGIFAHDFKMFGCPQIGFKNQFENLAARYFPTTYDANQAVSVGTVRARPQATSGDAANQTLWVSTANRTTRPDGDFAVELAAGYWTRSPYMTIGGGVIHSIEGDGCGQAIGFVASPEAYQIDQYVDTFKIHNVIAKNGTDGLYIERMPDARVSRVTVEDMTGYGMFVSDFGGEVESFKAQRCNSSGFFGYLSRDTRFERLEFDDVGQVTTGDSGVPMRIVTFASNKVLPSHVSNPKVYVRRLRSDFTSGSGPSDYVFYSDSDYPVSIQGERSNDSSAEIRIEGTLIDQSNNQHSFHRSTDNDPKIAVANDTSSLGLAFDVSGADLAATKNTLAQVVRQLQAVRALR